MAIHEDMQKSEFLWTMPCYLLASNVRFDQNGLIVLDDKAQFISPPTERFPRNLALFTDRDNAETYLELAGEPEGVAPLEITAVSELHRIVSRVLAVCGTAVVDPNPKAGGYRVLDLEHFVKELEARLADPSGR